MKTREQKSKKNKNNGGVGPEAERRRGSERVDSMKMEEVKELLWRSDVLLTVAALKIGCKGRVSLETWR